MPEPAPKACAAQLEVLLPTALGHGFDYACTHSLPAGTLVRVPFGKAEQVGVVWGEGKATLAREKLRDVASVLDEFPPLAPAFRQFIDWVAWYTCSPKGGVLKMALPVANIERAGRLGALEAPPLGQIQLAPLAGAQAQAADALGQRLGKGFSVQLLDGVTGSGKTEVYFDTIARLLHQDETSQALVLLPEIALSVQFLSRFESRFGFLPLVWNSSITPARRRQGWQAIAKGQARVVVGARSALFLPYRRLGLIVIDEEHDASYKQQEGVIYHARDMAVARARFEAIPVALISATPSLETHFNARQGKYRELTLPARHGAASLPRIELIDMRREMLERGHFLSRTIRDALAHTLAAGHQSLLFLNRRGYAPLLLCRTCGHRFQCGHCSAWLVLHRKNNNASKGESQQTSSSGYLSCHHCGHKEALPCRCPSCLAEESLHPCGPGVERLQEEVSDFLPQARVSVLASDHQGEERDDLASLLQDMAEGRIDILIGTQIVAKGHHFANLATVGVVDADLGLAGGDLRATEHTYQLLHQLSGRAGREHTSGQVYLQSYLPTHPVMQALCSGDRDQFLAAELEARRNAHMPPFARLAALIIDSAQEGAARAHACALARIAPRTAGLNVLGPAPAPLSRLRGRYRFRLLAQAARQINLPEIMRAWVESCPAGGQVRVRIDIDPITFL